MGTSANRLGFTLIELAIVLTIVGLLSGGVLVGKELIRDSELKSLVTEVDKINGAVSVFREKYGYLPGDFPKAQTVWGRAASGCGTLGVAAPGPEVGVCNGNGNGKINSIYQEYEHMGMWAQMAAAGLIKGIYASLYIEGSGWCDVYTDYHTYKVKWSGVGMTIAQPGTAGWYERMDSAWFLKGTEARKSHKITLGKGANSGCIAPYLPFLNATEAYNVDLKFDDGKPGTGIISQFRNDAGFANSCVTTNVAATSAYTTTNVACPLIFDAAF